MEKKNIEVKIEPTLKEKPQPQQNQEIQQEKTEPKKNNKIIVEHNVKEEVTIEPSVSKNSPPQEKKEEEEKQEETPAATKQETDQQKQYMFYPMMMPNQMMMGMQGMQGMPMQMPMMQGGDSKNQGQPMIVFMPMIMYDPNKMPKEMNNAQGMSFPFCPYMMPTFQPGQMDPANQGKK